MAAELETPVTIDKNSVSIDENPVTIPDTPLTIDESGVTTTAADETALPADVVALEPKKKGRPPGSKNKEPGCARKPRAKVVPIDPVPPEPDYDAPALPGSRRIPTEARDSREALMLRLLSQQANAR